MVTFTGVRSDNAREKPFRSLPIRLWRLPPGRIAVVVVKIQAVTSWIDNQGGRADFEWTEPGADATNLELGDDETREVDFPENFRFNFFGETYSSIFTLLQRLGDLRSPGGHSLSRRLHFQIMPAPMGMLAHLCRPESVHQ